MNHNRSYLISDVALFQISSNIFTVNLPVNVFCWLGWYEHRIHVPLSIWYKAPCPNFQSESRMEHIFKILLKAILPKHTITLGCKISKSRSRNGWQLFNSSGFGLFAGGAQRPDAVKYKSLRTRPSSREEADGWFANPARYNAGYKNPPDASPVKFLPVRLEPCAPGASPTTTTRASGSPNPGTGLPQYSWSIYALRLTRATSSRHSTSRAHFRHWIISLFSCSSLDWFDMCQFLLSVFSPAILPDTWKLKLDTYKIIIASPNE